MKYADYYLLDSFNLKTNQVGGTGLNHDWNKSSELIKELNKIEGDFTFDFTFFSR